MNKGMNIGIGIKSTNVCYHVVGFSWGQLNVGHFVSEAYGVKV